MFQKIKAAFAKLKALGSAIASSRWTARSTAFAAFFAITGFYLALTGRLTDQYVALVTALHVSVTTRSIFEDRAKGSDQ